MGPTTEERTLVPRMKRLLFALVACAVLLASPTCANDGNDLGLTTSDRETIRQIIHAQLGAFKRDDGSKAFSYASLTVRKFFQNVDNFMTMVKNKYSAVYRSKIVNFGEILDVGGEPVQRVFIVGEDGKQMIAAYVMQKQPSGDWKINGVFMFRDISEAT